jgi:uncharacterized protein involved in outer membrane biogenesis/outer membrane protein OmpA-like peptidoglycan-associated protein
MSTAPKRTTRHRPLIVVAVVVLALVALYAATGFLLAPWLVERYLPRYVADHYHRHATVSQVSINPFLLTFEAHRLVLDDADGKPMLAVDRLYADLELSSITDRAWTFRDAVVSGLDVRAELDKKGRLNFAALAPAPAPKPQEEKKSESAPRLNFQRIELQNGKLTFRDLADGKPATLVVDPINVTAKDIATVPGREGDYQVTARLPGNAALSWQGKLALAPLASSGTLSLKQLDVATAWPFLRDTLRLEQPQGVVDASARYRYRHGAKSPLVIDDADLRVSKLKLVPSGGKRPIVALASLHAAKGSFDLATRAAVVPTVEAGGGALDVIIDAQGRINWASLTQPTPPSKPGPAWSLRMPSVRLHDIAFRYADRHRASPLIVDAAQAGAQLALALTSSGGTTRTQLDRTQVKFSGVAVTTADAREPWIRAQALALDGGHLDTAQRELTADALTLSGAQAAFLRDAHGRFGVIDALAQGDAGSSRPAGSEGSTKPWQFRVGTTRIESARIAVGDASYRRPVRYDLAIGAVTLKGYASGSRTPMGLQADVKIAQGGSIAASGTLAQDFGTAEVKVNAKGLALAPLQPIVARYARLAIKSGEASATASLRYARGGKPLLRVRGNADVSDLLVEELDTRTPFVKWKRFAADGIAFNLSPDRLNVKELSLQQLEGKVVVYKDRSVNLTKVLRKPGGTAAANEAAPRAEAQAAPAPRASATSAEGEGAMPVRVGRMRIERSTIDFSDLSLVLPFSTRVTYVHGNLTGISTDPNGRAALHLAGAIEDYGQASAEGSVDLRQPTRFMDIVVKFQNVKMPPLSPYTATFAGRKIASGELWLDLEYKITDQKLAGENRILLVNPVLGERVQAPNALDLPLDLALALLKDDQGRVRMAIPVSGDVGDPHFDYGAVIRKAIGSALTRIVTAPFRALASLFGGSKAEEEELGTVRFQPGSAGLSPPQREHLNKVASALKQRPQLKLVVHGPYDPQRDADAMKRLTARRDLATAMGETLKDREDPGPVAYTDRRTQRVIERLLSQRAGDKTVDEVKQECTKRAQAAKADGSEERRLCAEAMFERLVAAQPAPDAAVQALAQSRAQAIQGFLVKAGVDAARITIGEVRTDTDKRATVNTKLELEAAKAAS